jgi:hypothetical protein
LAATPAGQPLTANEPLGDGHIAQVRPVGMSEVVDVSKNGRLVLGKYGNKYVVRDVVAGKTLRTLPTSSSYRYVSLSSDGRYVLYLKTVSPRYGCSQPWVRDRVTNQTRLAAADSRGRAIQASFKTQDCEDVGRASMKAAMSANGRYVAFCANLQRPTTTDLYLKDMRTRKLTTVRGACLQDQEYDTVLPLQVSEDGRVILLPGKHDDFGGWQPATLWVRGAMRAGVGGEHPFLTDDGSAVYSQGPLTFAGNVEHPLANPLRYDIATRTLTSLPAGDPVSPEMSRRGRYVLELTDPWGTQPPALGVLDRTTQQVVDLTSELEAAGVRPPNGYEGTRLSSDGKVLFVGPSYGQTGTWVAVTLR